jgi:hypothetical protein
MANIKAVSGVVLLTFLLSLATWMFFYVESMPLDSKGTAVVCGGWALLVFSAKWLWSHFHKDRKKRK